MKLRKQPRNTSVGKRVDELHRPPTWFERFRAWIEGLPKDLLYAGLTVISWLSLTAMTGLDPRAPIERLIAQGVIQRSDLARIESSDLLQATHSWWMSLVGVGIVVATEMGIAWYFLERFGRRILKNKIEIRMVLAASLTILFTALARLFIEFSFNPYLTPLAGLSIIGTMLLGPRLMFLIVVVTAINVGIMSGNDFLLTAALLLGSGFAIYTVVRVRSRQRLLKAGLFSLGLATVLLPLLEDAFNILTPMRLLELSDPGNPLLQKLLRSAPGTFSHSMQVGNLAENAAERVGGDPLLARVGAYYHDIGKMEHPAYFIENQIAQVNPHATLSPALSAKVVKRHVKDGLEIGSAWGLPQEILDIIAQHHGSTRIEYFYRKALEESLDESEVNEADFRYSSGLPRSKEAGILMLADSIEATVKSLPKPTPKRIEDVVADTIRRKLEDGQFDECRLTMHDIHEVGEAIRESLIGFLGPRIEYPEEQTPNKAAAQKAAGDTT